MFCAHADKPTVGSSERSSRFTDTRETAKRPCELSWLWLGLLAHSRLAMVAGGELGASELGAARRSPRLY